ncbi:lysosomal Pro-X carboxypeptidase [Ceratina calcarata]|uniref:Lysosomal Pro-X carboxypeptidase n=1 Tax=Ceratina calcarata TaxID=156304 RepID=A0AAJ7JD32_9HYME|nr:lysosomal Pro-X carboxypeptidase [Ceratina calcarata]
MELRYILLFIFLVFCEPSTQYRFSQKFRGNYQKHPRVQNFESAKYKYEIKTIDMPVDHFSFSVSNTFKLRYLVNNTWQKAENPPIFFYTGNEGNIETFAQNTGFMWEIAPEFEALLIFAEHRYYGESMPYGNKSYADTNHLGYLTSQQALADYIDLIQYLRSKSEYKQSPVIAFGGSYGGMLSAWIRMKYPHIVQGAIASSAPILQFTGSVECDSFARIVSLDFKAADPNCAELIRKSWGVITNITSTDEGKKWLSDNWELCQPLKNTNDVEQLKAYLEDVYGNLAMANYPYEASFLAPLPAYPVNVVCSHLTNESLTGTELLLAVQNAVNVYTNYTGEMKCLDVNNSTPLLDAGGWPFQSCTEMVMPMCTNGVNDMFEPHSWNFDEYSKDCEKQFSVKPQPNLACEQYGCERLSTATNIVFSNGLMDPWAGGGVIRNLSASAVAIIIPEGAHHLDLRASNPSDPFSVVLARSFHRSFIKQWITDYSKNE